MTKGNEPKTYCVEVHVDTHVPILVYATGNHIDDLMADAKYCPKGLIDDFYEVGDLSVRSWNKTKEAFLAELQKGEAK